MSEMHRQGDVLFIRVDEIPQEAEKRETKVLVEGEVTGHAHRVHATAAAIVMGVAQQLFVEAQKATAIVHEEHGTVILGEGLWKVVRQREYTPKSWEYVAD